MQEWLNTTMQNLQSGDISTGLMVLVGLLVLFFVVKLLMSTMKAVIIVFGIVVTIAILMPQAGILEKAKDMTEQATDYVKENATKESIDALKEKALNLAK